MKKVLSWIIAIGFSGILVQPVQWLLGLIPWEKFILKENWIWLIKPQFSFLNIVVFLILIIAITYISKLIFKMGKCHIAKKKEESLKKINSYTDEEDGIKVTWDVGIGSLYNNNPFAYNIQIFCTKHGNVPLRMIGGHCTDPTCPNAIKYFNKNIIKNNIESVLIDAQNKNS